MKWKGLLAVLICMMMLSACSLTQDETTGTEPGEGTTSNSVVTDNLQPTSPSDFSSEQQTQLPDELEGQIDHPIEERVFDIIIDDIQEHLDMGMAILYTDETIMLDDADCYLVELGTNHEDQFVREFHYAVNTTTEQVYLYDVITDTWEELP